jgi:hypothetical protein
MYIVRYTVASDFVAAIRDKTSQASVFLPLCI